MTTLTQQILADIDGLPLEMQEETLDFVRFLKAKLANHSSPVQQSEPNGTELARLMEEASSKVLFASIEDPLAWQREIRQERPLPGRVINVT